MIAIYCFVVYTFNCKRRVDKRMLTESNQIEEFLNEYKRSRVIVETTVRAILNRARTFEKKFQKPFYEFTVDEALEMYKSTHAISIRTLHNVNLTLKHASRWILDRQGQDIKNVYDNITKELMLNCIDTDKKANLIITKDDLIDIQNELLNYTDKAILFMLFEGAGGHMLKELTFMDESQISKKDLKIFFRSGKTIDITPEDYNLLNKGFKENELISFGVTNRVSKVRSLGLYKARFNALSDNANPHYYSDVERRYRFIQRRIMLISKDLGITLTSGSIQESGLLHYIKEGMKASGLSFLEFIRTEEAKALARRYDLYTELYVQVLKDKFYKYFQ